MEDSITAASLAELHSARVPPCLSLYQPTHRSHPGQVQDPILFRNLVKSLEASLRKAYPAGQIEALLKRFATLAEDHAFWTHARDGLAVFAAEGVFQVHRLQRTVPPIAIVADSFHTTPLRRFLQSADRFQMLALSRDSLRLFEGNRDSLDEIEAGEGVPKTMADALGTDLTDPHLTVASYGGVGATRGAMHHGHGGRKDEVDLDTEKYFRAVDRAVLARHSRPSGLPLMLAALPEHQSLFRRVSRNPFLMEAGLAANPYGIAPDSLRQRAWEVMRPQIEAREAALAQEFAEARARGRGSDDLRDIAVSAVTGRVATLLIESGRQLPGRLDGASGAIRRAELDHPQVDDLLDDLCAVVESKGGVVHVVRADRMPGVAGVAATYRH
jgi:hypothetical protein